MSSVGQRPGEWAAMAAAYRQAVAAVGELRFRRTIADAKVELWTAGPAMVPYVVPAFDHLPSFEGDADLTVRVWDSASTGVPLPAGAGSLYEHTTRGLPGEGPVDDIATSFLFGSGGLSFFHGRAAQGYYWMPAAGNTPYYDRATPLKAILHWFLGGRGSHVLHGGAVGLGGRGVLIAGASGAGKSTTCHAALSAGLDYVADDHCALTWSDSGQPEARTLYASGKLTTASLALLPEFVPQALNSEALELEKALFLFADRHRAQLPERMRLAAILVPARTNGVARVERLAATAALTALAPSTLLQLPGARADALRQMARLVRTIPAFTLHLGDDVRAVPSAITTLLHGLDAARCEQ